MIRRTSHRFRSPRVHALPVAVPVACAVLVSLALGVFAAGPAAAQSIQLLPQSWGLDRIDQHPTTLDGQYHYAATGAGVHVFVVDSGIRSTHVDLAGRVDTANAFTTITDGLGTEDCTGHGTAVAAAVGGVLSGVAKGVVLHPVRVKGCSGDPTSADLAAAVDWVTETFLAHQKGKASGRWKAVGVLSTNLSTTMPRVILNQALTRSIEAGLTWVAPAGDRATDACGMLQPVLALPAVIVVGATDLGDRLATFSNTGSCVDLVAPGVGLNLPSAASDTARSPADGTALAAAHVAGTAALLLEQFPDATPGQVERTLTAWSTDTAAGHLVYSYFVGDGLDRPPVPWLVATCRLQQRDCVFDASGSFDDHAMVSYDWDFGDGDTTTHKGDSIHHKYGPEADTFTVTLTVTDDAGQTASRSVNVVLGY